MPNVKTLTSVELSSEDIQTAMYIYALRLKNKGKTCIIPSHVEVRVHLAPVNVNTMSAEVVFDTTDSEEDDVPPKLRRTLSTGSVGDDEV